MGTKYEKHYSEFRAYMMRGWKLETIAKHLGVTVVRLKSADYIARYRKEMGTAQVRPQKTVHRIDKNRMYELIHLLEQRYEVGKRVGGRQIKFGDETIPESDPQLRELRRVVNGK